MKKRNPDKDAELIKEILDDYKRFLAYWEQSAWKEGDRDMKAQSVEGDWPKEVIDARKANLSPCDHYDIISQLTNRVINQAAQNPLGVTVEPVGEGGNEETAQRREKRQREISYRSKADQARLTALQHAVERGMGHWIVRVDYMNADSFNQHILVEEIKNPKSVLMDPDASKTDRSDAKKALFLGNKIRWDDFAKQYPNAERKSFDAEHMKESAGFTSKESVIPAEYWRVESTPVRLLNIQGLGKLKEDDLRKKYPDATFEKHQELGEFVTLQPGTPPLPVLNSRMSERCRVVQYITNGVEILEENDWLGTTIPIITVTGREKYEDGKLVIESMTRKMRAGQFAYDVAKNAAIEALLTQSSWVYADGQIEGFDGPNGAWRYPQKARLLPYKPLIDSTGQKQLPPPHREMYQADVQAAEMFAQSALRDVQNAAGMSTLETINRTSKSGIAQERLDQAADINAFHHIKSWKNGIEYEGRIINEIQDKVEDSARVVGLRDKDGTYDTEPIEPQQDAEGNVVNHPYGPSESHDVTIDAGPDYQSQREEASEFANLLIEKGYSALAPLAIKLKNIGPLGDQMFDVMLATLPPEIQQAYNKDKNKTPIPPEAQAQITQLQQALQQATQALQQVQQELETKKYAVDSDERIQGAKLKLEESIQSMDHELELAKIRADVEKSKRQSGTILEKTDRDNETRELIALHQTETTSLENAADRDHALDTIAAQPEPEPTT